MQVKGKTSLHGPETPIALYEKHLFTPDQLVIGVHLDGDRLGPFVLVADAATFSLVVPSEVIRALASIDGPNYKLHFAGR